MNLTENVGKGVEWKDLGHDSNLGQALPLDSAKFTEFLD
jgi:hypothetical protein